MSIWRSSETYVHHDPFNSVLRIGNVEVSEAVLEEMLEVAEFILFLRARDPSWESLGPFSKRPNDWKSNEVNTSISGL